MPRRRRPHVEILKRLGVYRGHPLELTVGPEKTWAMRRLREHRYPGVVCPECKVTTGVYQTGIRRGVRDFVCLICGRTWQHLRKKERLCDYPEAQEEILRLYDEGANFEQIARQVQEKFGVKFTPSAISRHIRRHRPTYRPKYLKLNPEIAGEVLRLHGEGMNTSQIAEHIKEKYAVEYHPQSISRYIRYATHRRPHKLEAYPEVQETILQLRREGLTASEISRKVEKMHGVKFDRKPIRMYLRRHIEAQPSEGETRGEPTP